jgi:hypothetical protein
VAQWIVYSHLFPIAESHINPAIETVLLIVKAGGEEQCVGGLFVDPVPEGDPP